MIQFENITFHYPNSRDAAIQSIRLSVQNGESLAVMGANGSGKSTFAKLLASLLKPERGSINISNSSSDIPVGIIFQNPDNQMIAMTVEKELAFALENLGLDNDIMERKISEMFVQFNIEHLRNRITSELSGGEKQRVAIASVMIAKPDILILDEPDSFLDRQGQKVLLEQLDKIHSENPDIIIIHITQYPEIAKKYKRLLVFYKGEIAADAPPEEIFSNHSFALQTCLRYQNSINENSMSEKLLIKPNNETPDTIEVKDLTFGYTPEKLLFNNLSFSLRAGEVLALVGASGSGKSTLASILCNLIPTEENSISFHLNNNKKLQFSSRYISAVLQQPERQFFLTSADKEVKFGPNNFGVELSPSEIADYFSLVGLEYKLFRDRDPFSLSGGEKRRLAFAAVLAISTNFIIFDEPTCGLDPIGVGHFMKLVENLRLLNIGIVIISHDGEIISQLADSVLFLKSNAKSVKMTKRQFFDNPNHAQIVSPL